MLKILSLFYKKKRVPSTESVVTFSKKYSFTSQNKRFL